MCVQRLVYCITFLGVMATAASADRVIRVEPGLWEYSHNLSIPGLVPAEKETQSYCVKPDEAERNLSDLLAELSKDGGCTVSNLKDDLSRVSFDLECTPDLNGVSITASGNTNFRYGRTKITGHAVGKVMIGETEVTIDATGEANRVGRCE